MNPVVIVGTGMAGYTLAREFRKLNAETPLVMVTADDGTNYSKPNLSTAFVAGKQPDQLAQGEAARMAETLNAKILPFSEVTGIVGDQHLLKVRTPEGEQELPYSKLVLAVGASPIRLPVEGDGAGDILFVNSLQDYRKLREAMTARSAKKILLIGAGLIGCEFANDLAKTGHEVILTDIAPHPLGRLLPHEVAVALQTALEKEGVKFELGTTVSTVRRDGDKFAIEFASGHHAEVDLVLSAVGLRPNLQLAEASGLHTSRGIVANEFLETSLADIYTLGDSAEVNGYLLPYIMPIMQQARALAKTLNGDAQAVHYPAMPVAVKTPSAPLVILPPPASTNHHWTIEQLEDGLIAKAVDEGNALLGFALLGPTAGKQRMALAKEVPDLMPL